MKICNSGKRPWSRNWRNGAALLTVTPQNQTEQYPLGMLAAASACPGKYQSRVSMQGPMARCACGTLQEYWWGTESRSTHLSKSRSVQAREGTHSGK